MKRSVYIETTIISYLTAQPSRDLILAANCELTREWWQRRRQHYDLYTSQFVLDEAGDGDPEAAARRRRLLKDIPLLDLPDDTIVVATGLVRRGLLPVRATTDAAHLAAATLNRMGVLLTWNCRHLANADLYGPISSFLRGQGYEPPIVCTPNELMGEE